MSRQQVSPGTVHEFVRALTATVDPEVLLDKVGGQFQELFGPDLVLIFQVEPPRGDFIPLYSHGYDRSVLDGLGLAGRGRLSGWLAENRKCLQVTDQLGLMDQLDPGERDLLRRLRAKLCVPLVSPSHLVGIALLGSHDPAWRLDPEDQQLLETLSAQAALSLENAILHSHQKERLKHFLMAERLGAMGQVAAGVVHEIRNPLTAISSTLQYLLQDFAADHPKRPLVEELLSEVARIDGTLHQLLDLAQVRDFQPRIEDVLDPLDKALLLLEGEARRRGVEIVRTYDGEAFLVAGDAGALRQLFLNLLLNAVQAMPGGGTIRVRVQRWDSPLLPSEGPRVQIEIEDAGCGIPESERERLFEPFFTTKPQGTGLGLAICQSIAERHQGEIEMYGEPGKGTTACVRIPLVD